ncbi:MAG: DUF998 domain-containing protein [Pseudoxanthomonas sp.]
MKAAARHAGWIAAVFFAAAVGGFGAALDGYSQLGMPVALLGARGFPHALAFNLLAFVLPGMLAGVVAMILRRGLPASAGWSLRIGAQLVFLSALAFIAMGLLPLDPGDLESEASQLHGTAWMLWTVAFVPGAVLLGAGLLAYPATAALARLSLLIAAGVLLAGFVFTDFMPAGLAQRIAFGLWLVWMAVAGLIGVGPATGR